MIKKTKRLRVEEWLKKYKKYLTIVQFEEELKFPKDGITNFFSEKVKRKLKDNEIEKLDEFILDMFFSYEEYDDEKKKKDK